MTSTKGAAVAVWSWRRKNIALNTACATSEILFTIPKWNRPSSALVIRKTNGCVVLSADERDNWNLKCNTRVF